MDSDDKAWDLLAQAKKNRDLGNHADSLRDFSYLMRANPNAFPFFNLFQRTYVLSGLLELAKNYPAARKEMEYLLREKRKELSRAPDDPYLLEDVAFLESGLDAL
jgi:tetratricopeptide (TPR) repeat protein